MKRIEISYSEIDGFLDKAQKLLVPHWGDYRDVAFTEYLNKVKTSGPEFIWTTRYLLGAERKTSTYRKGCWWKGCWWFTDEEYELARELLSPYAKVLIKMRQAE